MNGLVQMDQWDMMCCWATGNPQNSLQWSHRVSHSELCSLQRDAQRPEAGEQKNRKVLGLKEHQGAEQPLCLYRKSRTLWGWLQGKN